MTDMFTPIGTSVPWGGYDWSKKSLAVCASDGCNGSVLWTVGAHVEFDLKESGLANQLDELGLDDAPAGISIWEGKTAGGERLHEGDYADTYLKGEFREPTAEEWAAIREGRCPWDGALWLAYCPECNAALGACTPSECAEATP